MTDDQPKENTVALTATLNVEYDGVELTVTLTDSREGVAAEHMQDAAARIVARVARAGEAAFARIPSG